MTGLVVAEVTARTITRPPSAGSVAALAAPLRKALSGAMSLFSFIRLSLVILFPPGRSRGLFGPATSAFLRIAPDFAVGAGPRFSLRAPVPVLAGVAAHPVPLGDASYRVGRSRPEPNSSRTGGTP